MTGKQSSSNIEQYNAIIGGRLNLADASAAVRSWFRLHLFLEACKVLELKTIEERRKAIESYPDTYRTELKTEITRIWEEQKSRR